jgi:hypothetical protein
MAGKAAQEDDLFALAAKGGSAEAEVGFPDGGILLGPDGRRGVNPAPDEGFKTRVKPPVNAKDTPKEVPTKRLPRGNVAEKQAADIAETLEEKFAMLFGLLAGVVPVTSTYGTENAPKAITALLDIGKRRPGVMKALLKIADGADTLELGKFILGIVVALQVDFGKLQGDEIQAKAFGVTAVLEKYFKNPEYAGSENPNVTEQVVSNGQRFSPVA